MVGSSPPTWGIRTLFISISRTARFIPTYVGHTREWTCNAPKRSVHPHLRGAYGQLLCNVSQNGGSSPPTWGIRSCFPGQIFITRFIPTYVGHTYHPVLRYLPGPVHPHLRGAYPGQKEMGTKKVGSSPPTWGILGRRTLNAAPHAVHPHLRGAYWSRPKSTSSRRGSSPPTWGILDFCILDYRPHRFIPTYVGHTWRSRPKTLMPAVHPHLRGAYFRSPRLCPPWLGSSPPTWGIQPDGKIGWNRERFIPTYVGHTHSWAIAPNFCAVHPHLRGAYGHWYRVYVVNFRFIPTYVGHTIRTLTNRVRVSVHPHLRGAYTGPP